MRWILEDTPGAKDEIVLARAQSENQTVLTFGELAFRAGLPADSGVILVRVPMLSPGQVSATVLAAFQSRTDWLGHFSVIEADRIRMTPLLSNRS